MPTLGGLGQTGLEASRAGLRRAAGAVLALVPRRLMRIAEKIEKGRGRPWGQWSAAGFLAAAALYGLILGGHLPRLADAALSVSGLGIETVEITGHAETPQLAVLEKLETGGQALPTFDADAARGRVKELPWVAEATVRKLYPHTLSVAVEERRPFALWQEGGEVSLIDREGTIIVAFEEERFAHLPLVVGAGANVWAAAFLGELADHASLAQRMRAAILVAERRWDLVLDDDLVVKLPERGAYEAMADLVELDRAESLLAREVTVVDLRLPDRIIVHVPDRTAKPASPGGAGGGSRVASGPGR